MNCALCETRTMIRTKPITALRPFHGGKTHLAYSPYRSGLTRFSVQLLLSPQVRHYTEEKTTAVVYRSPILVGRSCRASHPRS